MDDKLFEEFNIIQEQITTLKKLKMNVPIALYFKQFEILTELNNNFENKHFEDISAFALGIKYNMRLKYLAEKIGKSTDIYKQKIRDYSAKMTGKEVTDEEMDIVD